MLDQIRDSLDHCVKCTICETACPVSNVTPLFPGPKYAGPQSERFRGTDHSPDHSLDYCSSCGICSQVCPQGVKIAEINSRARAELKAEHGVHLRDRLLARPVLIGQLTTPVAPLANLTLRLSPARRGMELLTGIHRDAPLPSYAGRTFQGWWRQHRSPATGRAVAYFHGCAVNYNEPRLGEMAVAVLEHNGFEVFVPPRQGCCGLPLQSNGVFDDARRYVRTLVERLLPYARRGMPIVGTSTSCTLMLKREAHEILGVQDEDLALVSRQIWDVSEFLADLHDRGELRTDFRETHLHVPYHAPCQQKGHGMGKPALDLFSLIPGLLVDELDWPCCGIAGTYGLKREKYDIAMKVGAGLFDQVRSSGAPLSVCDSETCRWHLVKATGIESVHPIELLHRAYGLD